MICLIYLIMFRARNTICAVFFITIESIFRYLVPSYNLLVLIENSMHIFKYDLIFIITYSI